MPVISTVANSEGAVYGLCASGSGGCTSCKANDNKTDTISRDGRDLRGTAGEGRCVRPASVLSGIRCRPNMPHIRQSMPDPGLGFQVKILDTFQVVRSFWGIGKETKPTLWMARPRWFKFEG